MLRAKLLLFLFTAIGFSGQGAVAGLVWTGDVADDSVSGVSTTDARAAASLLDDFWRATVASDLMAQGFGASEITLEMADILNPTTDTLSGGTGLFGTSSPFSNGVSFTYTLVHTQAGATDTGTADTSAVREWQPRLDFLQEQAPVPTEALGFTGLSEQASGPDPLLPLNAVLFEFSADVENFGIFIGDVASRSQGQLAEVRLFDASDNLLLQQSLQYSGTILTDGVGGSTTYNEGDSAPVNNNLNRWGDDQTAFVGFSDVSNVRQLLIVVGDDDVGGTGANELLSFVGASIGFASVPEPSALSLLLIGGILGLGFRGKRLAIVLGDS